MKRIYGLRSAAAGIVLSAAGLAQAGNVYWSIGVHQPGVHVGVSNVPPVVVQYPVVVHSPRPVVVAPVHHHGWVPPGHRHAKHNKSRNQQVTHVHHHHYHGSAPVTVVQSAPPNRPHWR
ncbi:hypothetical protein [Tepidicella baoligensis]|uniref:hypothetical protein n=1 Tax=Tepidicella baoligensis TaxID=2707016 RepID=UPI0015D9DE1F|nr:hypothetical protein [Tepidicella baoligensis]